MISREVFKHGNASTGKGWDARLRQRHWAALLLRRRRWHWPGCSALGRGLESGLLLRLRQQWLRLWPGKKHRPRRLLLLLLRRLLLHIARLWSVAKLP